MPQKTQVASVMTRKVHTLDVSEKLSAVRRALIANEFHHMPIVDGERLVGMISWRDLVRAYRGAREANTSGPASIDAALDERASVAEVMTRKLVTVRDDDPLDRAIDEIADAHIHSVLVLDSDERLVGILTDKNIVEFLAS
jgi:CBS domain-containing protein